MNGNLAEEALEVGAVLRDSIAASGGVDLLRRAAVDPSVRGIAGDLLDAVGLWELDPLGDPLELEVAAAASQAAGFHALPYPLVERLARRGAQATTLIPVSGTRAATHVDLPLEWSALDLRGAAYRLRGHEAPLGTRLAPFTSVVDVEPTGERDAAGAALLATLEAWWLLGLLEHAVADTVVYTREREQFGRALIKFQGVSFQLAEMTVETSALLELAKYTLWSIAQDPDAALVDALGLRLAALKAAHVVLHGAHQLHGAMGFTDEVDVSWLSRASQAYRRLPEGEHRTAGLLTDAIAAEGWREFGHAPRAGVVAGGS